MTYRPFLKDAGNVDLRIFSVLWLHKLDSAKTVSIRGILLGQERRRLYSSFKCLVLLKLEKVEVMVV